MLKILQTTFLLFISLVTLLISGCSSQTEYRFDQDYDFSQVKTYGIFPRESKFSDIQHLSDFQRNRIEISIENVMEQRNFSYAEYEKADVVVSYFWVGRSLQELREYNKGVKACLGCSPSEQQDLNKDIKSSMLIIDIIDNANQRSVYRSFVKIKLKEGNSSDENNDLIIEAVAEMLANFPPESV
ncbi:DUF4136 domain-containing protein [Colwelliaceae bacterium BS250]